MSESTKKHKATASKKLKFAVFVCSTSRYQQLQRGEIIEDISGDIIEDMLKKVGHVVMSINIIADDKATIKETTNSVLNSADLDAAIFCGGTGLTSKDFTIEAVSPFFEKSLPGFGEVFRHLSYEKMGSAAIMSRAIAGVAKGKVLFCIPGSPDAVRVSVEMLILPEASHIVRHARE
jgi:molybdenum cofactor biosynthesis protein B